MQLDNRLLKTLILTISFAATVFSVRTQPQSLPDKHPEAAFRVQTEMTLLHVGVTDRNGNTVTDIRPGDIHVYEDGVEQEVLFFSPDRTPLTHGLLLDSSGSMGRGMKMPLARAAAFHFVETSSFDDSVFLIDFDSQANLTLDFTSNLFLVAEALKQTRADGRTALFDAVYLALSKLRDKETENRKVILLISDGADTASLYSYRDVLDLAKESDVQIYVLGILGQDRTYNAVNALQGLAEETGGLSYFPRNPQRMVQICLDLAQQLRRQYLLGYRSSNPVQNGKWRKIKLKVRRRDGGRKMIARTRKGYYARNQGMSIRDGNPTSG